MSQDRDLERRLEAWFEEEARPMPTPVLEAALEAIPRASRRRAGGWLIGSPRWSRSLGTALAAVILVAAVVVSPQLLALVVPSSPNPIGSARACAPAAPGLIGWWPGDGTGRDLVGNRGAQLSGNATFAPGLVGQAFALDGNADFASVADSPSLNVGTGDFSVDLWVRFASTAGEQVLVEKWIQRYGEGSSGWTLTKLDDNVVGFYTDGPGGGGGTQSDPEPLRPNTWYHVAARREGTKFAVFLDGAPVASNAGPAEPADLGAATSLKFGHRGGPDDTPGSQDPRGFFLNGQIDEVQLFVGHALSDDEINDIHAAGSAGTCKP